jgi:predicted AAA+ superfamily ATPase
MIKRTVINHIRAHLVQREITMISGARQVGKTTLMNLLMDELRAEGKQVLFLSFDYESDRPCFESQDAIISRIRLEFGNCHGFVFMDEIQRKENAGLFLKGLYDMGLPWKFIISGSGSIELKERISESLAGRKRIFEVAPVSFMEFLDYRTGYQYSGRLSAYINLNYSKTLISFNEYLNFGGYPRVVTAGSVNEKLALINEIYNSYIDRDIQPLLRGDRPEAYGRLLQLLAAQTGMIMNLSNLANDARLSVPTIQKHLWYAEKTYFIKLITPYFNNVTKEITKSPMVYFNDHGMRNFALSSFGSIRQAHDFGFVFQNMVGNLLLQELHSSPFRVHFWRTTDKAEVDFVISRMDDPIPVEVKFSVLRKPAITRSLRSFIEKYKPTKAWVVNLSLTDSIAEGPTEIEFIPFHELAAQLQSLVKSIETNFMVQERAFPYRITGRSR